MRCWLVREDVHLRCFYLPSMAPCWECGCSGCCVCCGHVHCCLPGLVCLPCVLAVKTLGWLMLCPPLQLAMLLQTATLRLATAGRQVGSRWPRRRCTPAAGRRRQWRQTGQIVL